MRVLPDEHRDVAGRTSFVPAISTVEIHAMPTYIQFEQQIGISEYFSWKVHELSEFRAIKLLRSSW